MPTTPASIDPAVFDAGPWDRAFAFHIPFPLRSKSNFRRGSRSREWASEQSFRQDVAVLAGAALPAGWVLGRADEPVVARPAFAMVIVATSTLDTANLAKSVPDALEHVVYLNDAQVRFQTSLSIRARAGQDGLVAVAALAGDASLHDLATAGCALVSLATDLYEPRG